MALTASEARRDLFGLIERVNQDRTEVEITSKRGSAVLMSKDEYDALVETSYLLRSPKNAERLLNSMTAARAGTVSEHELIAVDANSTMEPAETAGLVNVPGERIDPIQRSEGTRLDPHAT
jgi:antitoxin YefM